MDCSKTILEVFYHIAKKHPELINNLNNNFSDFEQDFEFKGTFYYSKNKNCELTILADKYGSDKGIIDSSKHRFPWPYHTYTDFYQRLWGHCRNCVKKVFECGLGTNNPKLPSSMGLLGKPGASLRMWRDYFPFAQIYGADIDKNILFSEERIQTYFIDQLDPELIKNCWNEIDEFDFDFILDDGLHTFNAGSCLFVNSIDRLSKNGIYVIEDVNVHDLRKYKSFFKNKNYIVDYVTMYKKNFLGDNSLVVIRKN